MTSLKALRGPALRRFLRHYVEMVVVMVAGMAILGPVESALLNPLGWAELRAQPELGALIMATNMTVPMVAWMCYRGHRWLAGGQMAAAMYLPFVAFFPLLWLDLVSAMGLMVAGHVLMVPAMTVAMLWHVEEYTGHDHQPARA